MSSSDLLHDVIKPARIKRMKIYFDVFMAMILICWHSIFNFNKFIVFFQSFNYLLVIP
jgi:hypothetical protein